MRTLDEPLPACCVVAVVVVVVVLVAALVVVGLVVVADAPVVVDELAWPEPPHPPISRKTGISPIAANLLLTRKQGEVDIR